MMFPSYFHYSHEFLPNPLKTIDSYQLQSFYVNGWIYGWGFHNKGKKTKLGKIEIENPLSN